MKPGETGDLVAKPPWDFDVESIVLRDDAATSLATGTVVTAVVQTAQNHNGIAPLGADVPLQVFATPFDAVALGRIASGTELRITIHNPSERAAKVRGALFGFASLHPQDPPPPVVAGDAGDEVTK